MTFTICHLWADALNWNGSQGNLRCLTKRLEWRGISPEIKRVSVGETVDFSEYDLVYIGAGKAYENHSLLRDVAANSEPLQRYTEAGGVLLAVCEGYELLGQAIALQDGSVQPGLCVLNTHTVYSGKRLTGNALADSRFGKLVYFENHAGLVHRANEVPALGRILKGHGNNGSDGSAGVLWNNVFACQAHGPLLPKNPKLADEILSRALSRRDTDIRFEELNDSLEIQAHTVMIERMA